MIIVKRGKIEVKGIESEIKADLSILVRALYKEKALTREEILDCVETGLMSSEELKKVTEEKLDKLFEMIKSKMED